MASRTLLPESRVYAKEATKALAHHGLAGGFRDKVAKGLDSVELVELRNSSQIAVRLAPALAGSWWLHLSWTIRRVPRGAPVLWRSSFGLNVRGVPFVPDPSGACLVRYDVDNERAGPGLGPLGAHLNVLQPTPLDDHIHFPVLAPTERLWSVREILDLFLSAEFAKDIQARIGA